MELSEVCMGEQGVDLDFGSCPSGRTRTAGSPCQADADVIETRAARKTWA